MLSELEKKWMPLLLATWRKTRNRQGPPDQLLPRELREVGAAVRRLSLGLTRERALVGSSYMDDPELLGAYLLFFWPVSYAQGRSLLEELGTVPDSVLDLGAGPGPLAFAALDHGAARVTAADRSRPALDLAMKLAAARGQSLGRAPWDGLSAGSVPEGRYDLVMLGHVLNELWAEDPEGEARRSDLLRGVMDSLELGGTLLVLEPALRETSRALLRVRDRLVGEGFTVRAPCLYAGPCPALEKESDWCHGDREWEAPSLVQAIAKEAGLRKESLKMSYLLLSAGGEGSAWPPEAKGLFRIVSEPLHTKGRLRYVGCGPEGRVGLALPARQLGEANRVFGELRRGDVVAVEGVRPKGDGLGLDGESRVVRVAEVGQPLPRS